MQFPRAAMLMVGVGVVGLVGTGVLYYVEQMPEGSFQSNPFDDPIDPPPAVEEARKTAPSKSPKTPSESTKTAQQNQPKAEPEPDSCRALVNVRVGGTHDDVYDYRVLDVTFTPAGRLEVERGTGAAVAMPDGVYALQVGVDTPRGLPQQSLQARAIYEDGVAEMALWSSPDLDDGLPQNDGYILWPTHQNYSRLRSTIDRFVSVHNEVVNSEGGMREESGGVFDVQSGDSARPLRLNMSALRGRAAAFSHEKVANAEGSEAIWEQFEDKGEGDFLLRLANGPGKSVQPEAGVCCYESEGASQMVFVRLDRGAFALMAPGYLSRPNGFVRGGDGCGEFGWDGETVYARRKGGGTWMPLGLDAPDTRVHEFLGVSWLPDDSDFDVERQPTAPEWPTPEQLAERIEPLMSEGLAELEKGSGRKAAAKLREALRLKMLTGQEVTVQERLSYNNAVALSGRPEQGRRYFEHRMRVSDSAEEKLRIRRVKTPRELSEEFGDVIPSQPVEPGRR